MGKGGIGIPIDMETGELKRYGTQEFPRLQKTSRHTVANQVFTGFKIPLWDEVVEFINTLHRVFSYKFIAWDIAITDNGPIFIERNPPGDWCVPQIISDIPIFNSLPFQMHIIGNHREYLKKYEY